MMKWIGMALVATIAAFGVAANVAPAMAASVSAQKTRSVPAADLGQRRHSRHHDRYAIQPTYYGRPTVYSPAPFVPIPPLFGYGWEWW
jgi:hypothetical protein